MRSMENSNNINGNTYYFNDLIGTKNVTENTSFINDLIFKEVKSGSSDSYFDN